MAAVSLKIEGGEKLAAKLQQIANNLKKGRTLRVGFLENATYPAGDSEDFINKMRALRLQEKEQKASTRQIISGKNRYVAPKAPQMADRPRRARMADLGITTSLHVAQVAFWNEFGTITSPARPFFRNTIALHSPEWGAALGAIAKENGYDGKRILSLMGQLISDQIVETIDKWPADNAPLTVKLKGFNHGLIDDGTMKRSIDYEVVNGP